MKRSDRILKIIDLLKSGRWSAMQLAKHFGIDKRTVFRDFEIIRETGYALDTDFESRYFIVTDLRNEINSTLKLLNNITQNTPHKLLSDSIQNIEAFKVLRGL